MSKFTTNLKKLLLYLQGKKTSIATIISLILIFCLNRNYIPRDVGILIAGIMTALGLTVNIVSAKLLKKQRVSE